MNKKVVIAFLALLALCILGFLYYFTNPHRPVFGKPMVMVGNATYGVDVADTDSARTRGLSGHAPLAPNEGMFFIFQTTDNYGFWMKDMTFPIDIIWMDQDLKVVHIEKSVLPETYPKVFYPGVLSRYVLEVRTGQSDMMNIKIGDTAIFQKPA